MKTESPPLVVHIIYSLGTGGLENGLINIINRSPLGKYRHAIICLTTAQDFANRITSPDVQIVELNKNPGHDPALYWRLWKVLRGMNPYYSQQKPRCFGNAMAWCFHAQSEACTW